MKRIGPELKMPKMSELKVPPFLGDLFFDLRSRGLLPIVLLGIVAIAAVPFLLGGGGSDEEEPATGVVATPSQATGVVAGQSQLVVVQEENGLRDYRKRLLHRKPTNPFKQRFTSAESSGPELQGGESQGGSSGGEASPSGSSGGEAPASGSDGGSGGGSGGASGGQPQTLPGGGPVPKPGELISYAWAIDVQVTKTATKKGGGKETTGPTVHKRVLPYGGLPSTKVPVVVYMGPDPKTHKPMLLVSDGVASTFGEAKCLSGDETCQLLEVETGMPITFSYGPDLDRYKINVLKLYRVAIKRTQIERSLSQMSQNFSK